MCIIAAKPAGIKMPTEEQLEIMWFHNPDGAGIMYAKDERVYIDKGYMTLSSFLTRIKEIQKTVDLDTIPAVLHFRIASAGGIKPENCHPFPVTSSEKVIRDLQCTAKVGVAHNGTIHGYGNSVLSDTMQYIIRQIHPLSCAVPDFWQNRAALETIVNSTKGCWMVLLTGEGDLITIGDFFPERDGIFYSNKTFDRRPCFCDIYRNGNHLRADDLPEGGDLKYLTTIPLIWLEKDCQVMDRNSKIISNSDEEWLMDKNGSLYQWNSELSAAVPAGDIHIAPDTKALFCIDQAVFTQVYG